MKKAIIIILVVIAVIAGGAALKGNKKTVDAQPTKHTFGSGKSGVTLVEYGDFQCPGCGSFFPIVKEVKEKYKDYITFQFVNFPLSTLHQNAQAAHRAAHAAGIQGKFWEMHDLLYTNQNTWKDSTDVLSVFEGYASQLGLDTAKFKTDFASAETNSIIQADIKTGQALKVTGTPTFFLDGKQIEDNNTIASVQLLSDAIEKEIQAKTGTRPNLVSADTTQTTQQ